MRADGKALLSNNRSLPPMFLPVSVEIARSTASSDISLA
jgi:hypothetical protein